MGAITTKPFREAHLDIFHVAPSHKDECYRSAKEWAQLGAIIQAGTHMIDGKILYISAYVHVIPGVLEVFSHPSIYVPDYKFAMARHLKWWIQYEAQTHNSRRVQTYGSNTPESDRWLRYLGFEKEGVLHSFLPNGGSTAIWGLVCKPWDRS